MMKILKTIGNALIFFSSFENLISADFGEIDLKFQSETADSGVKLEQNHVCHHIV